LARHTCIGVAGRQIQSESWWPRFWDKAAFYWDLSKLRVDRQARLKHFSATLKPLVKEIGRHQEAGEGMRYSMHIYREIRWLLNFTPAAMFGEWTIWP
jgi:hypothetical protein